MRLFTTQQPLGGGGGWFSPSFLPDPPTLSSLPLFRLHICSETARASPAPALPGVIKARFVPGSARAVPRSLSRPSLVRWASLFLLPPAGAWRGPFTCLMVVLMGCTGARSQPLPHHAPRPWFWGEQEHRSLPELCTMVAPPQVPTLLAYAVAASPRQPRTCPTAGQGQDTFCTRGTASPQPLPPHPFHRPARPPWSDHPRAGRGPSSSNTQSPVPRDPAWLAHFLPSGVGASGYVSVRCMSPSAVWASSRARAQPRVPPARGTRSANSAQAPGSAQIFKCRGCLCPASWASPLSTGSSFLLPPSSSSHQHPWQGPGRPRACLLRHVASAAHGPSCAHPHPHPHGCSCPEGKSLTPEVVGFTVRPGQIPECPASPVLPEKSWCEGSRNLRGRWGAPRGQHPGVEVAESGGGGGCSRCPGGTAGSAWQADGVMPPPAGC